MNHKIQSQHLFHPKAGQLSSYQHHKTTRSSFNDLLQQQIHENKELKISKHAQKRLVERNILIDDSQWKTIHSRMNEAKQKGIKDSLVVVENAALVVNTENSTVITAMNRQEASRQLFTNINGAILID